MNRAGKLAVVAAAVLVLGAGLGLLAWGKLFREGPDQVFDDPVEQFKYGSLGGERDAGLPYWIWVVLPRVFPDLLPGPGGYASFGVVWEEGHELPVGFVKKTVGFPRVGNNCALCHTGTYRASPEAAPVVVPGAPAHSLNAQALLRFLTRAAADPRFESTTILREIRREVDLSLVDRLLYRFVIIPFTRRALLEQADKLRFIERPHAPPWGLGRDDAFNLPKFAVAGLPLDDTVGQCDFASVWNLKVREGPGLLLNWAGETPSVHSVLVDSSTGLGVRPGPAFERRLSSLGEFLRGMPPPRYPFPVDEALAARGHAIYWQACASCHEPGQPRTNKVIPLDEIGTDRERFDSWSAEAARVFNAKVREAGFERDDVGKRDGYLSSPLDGLWMRAPYLHNGSVPTLADLLEPPARRPAVFWRGCDVFDQARVGFVSDGPEARRRGFRHDVSVRGDGNGGHLYGTDLPPADKEALLEFLKTL
ncbi:MAG: hypothetical protein KBD01_01795 [Acidobacteria bacterium]|nr:hypothetical protein [Acidobacteriota bacterium]